MDDPATRPDPARVPTSATDANAGQPPPAGIGGRILVGSLVAFTSLCLLGYWYVLLVLSMELF